MRVLVIDVGGTHVKLATNEPAQRVSFPSGRDMTAAEMVEKVKEAVQGWTFDAVSIGYPGVVLHGRIAVEPRNLGRGWVGFDFAQSFGRPVKIANDAAMQALGSYEGGTMLFLGLGTGLGSALVTGGQVAPLELAHLPYRKGEYEDYVGLRGYEKFGKKKWRENVSAVVALLKAALVADYVVLGGGQTKLLKELPEGCRRGDNANAFKGGERVWESSKD